jgi:hypothetical protein
MAVMAGLPDQPSGPGGVTGAQWLLVLLAPAAAFVAAAHLVHRREAGQEDDPPAIVDSD